MKKKKQKPVEFTPAERRILGIPQNEPQVGPEAVTLRKIINMFPWLLDVAECGYDETVAHCLLQACVFVNNADIAKRNYWAAKATK